MKKTIKKQLLITIIFMIVICGLISFNNQSSTQSEISKDIKMYSATGRKELADETIKNQITSMLAQDFIKNPEIYSQFEGVNAPLRIFLAMQFGPQIKEGSSNKQISASFNSADLATKVPKNAKYMAAFRINNGTVERAYAEGSKEGNGIITLTDADFTTDGYISTGFTIKFDTNYTITDSDSFVAVFFTDEVGYIGYNLGINEKDDERIAFSAPNTYHYTYSGKDARMYFDATNVYANGDTYAITSVEPEDTEGEYTFLAWMDKESGESYPARLVEFGTSIPHYYNRSGSIQTLDAIWAYLKVNDVEEYYNGKAHDQEAEFGYSDALDAKYFDQLDVLGIEEKDIVKKWLDKDDQELSETPVDAGTYTEKFSKTIILENGSQSQLERAVKDDANVIIKKRNVTVSSNSLVKVYDGTPLVNNGSDGVDTGSMMDEGATPDNGNGWVLGEGIDTNTIQFIGSQTEIGKSSNTFTYEVNSNTKLSNYNITEEFGTLEVKPRYQVEYYYDDVKVDEETILYEMKSDDVYYEVGDVVNLLDDEAPATKKYNDKDYELSNVENEELTLTTVDEDNIIKVYYTSKAIEEPSPEKPSTDNPSTLDNISMYIGMFLVSLTAVIGIILSKMRSLKKENI